MSTFLRFFSWLRGGMTAFNRMAAWLLLCALVGLTLAGLHQLLTYGVAP